MATHSFPIPTLDFNVVVIFSLKNIKYRHKLELTYCKYENEMLQVARKCL